MTELFRTELEEGIKLLNIELSEEQKKQLFVYYNMIVEKNKVMNLTAITEEKEFVKKHIIDSLAVVNAGEEIADILKNGDIELIDVGTGAGLPGMVLKIAFPKLKITLFDSLMKRLKFLDEVIDKLGLNNITTLHGRAEDIGRDKKYRERFDIVVSRAVANMSTLSEYCIPLVKPLGVFVPYKSGEIQEELKVAGKAIKILGGEVCSSKMYELPGSDIKRSLIVIEKIKHTPMEYPRKAGVPSKEPIGSK